MFRGVTEEQIILGFWLLWALFSNRDRFEFVIKGW
jgi:hypothetical protein